MASTSIKDDRGFNQGFKETKALKIRTERRCKRIASHFKGSGKALEIGGGIGLHAYLIAKENKNIQIVSTDICEPFIKKASKDFRLGNLKYKLLDVNNMKAVEELLVEEGKFDYIFGDGILHHLYFQLDDVMARLKKILKPGGKILFWEPNLLNPNCYVIFKIDYFRKRANLEPSECAFSVKHIKKILEKNKFTDIKIVHKDFLLPNTPDNLINSVISIGGALESIPLLNKMSQSIFIKAENK